MVLKQIFPDTNISGMVVGTELWLVEEDSCMEDIKLIAERFREEFRNDSFHIDKILESFPWLLNLSDQQHVRVPVDTLQRCYFEDHTGSNTGNSVSTMDVSRILAYKQQLVEELSTTNILDYDRIITRSGYGGNFRF